jgi:hypothetical protein
MPLQITGGCLSNTNRRALSKQFDHNRKNQSAEIHHPAENHPILRFTPTGWNLR